MNRQRNKNNKKGDVNWQILSLVLGVLVFLAAIIGYNKLTTSGTEILKCKSQDGVCSTTCKFPSQIGLLSDKAAGCGKGEFCCVNITRTKPIDPLCMNAEGTEPLKFGIECDEKMYCDMAQVCVNLCEFCSTNFNNKQYATEVTKICGAYLDAKDKEKFGKGWLFSCSCTQKECNDAPERCATGYCSSDDELASDYACCAK